MGLACIVGSANFIVPGTPEPPATQNFETEISTPPIPKKQLKATVAHMERQFRSFPRLAGTNVELINEYIIRYTIPASMLFGPNEFDLIPQSAEYLAPVLNYLRNHGKYKVILAMHTDDTGSDSYLNILCENRILSLYDFFDSKIGNQPLIYGFAMGKGHPLETNNSFKSRAKNRRLEIYIVPGPSFLQDIKK